MAEIQTLHPPARGDTSPREVARADQDASALESLRTQPHNIAAEQALLGAILINNEAFHRVADFLLAEHFFEPVHQRIYEACARCIDGGRLADARALFHLFDEDEALADLDGAHYLGRLARAAETIVNALEYGRILHDLALKRGIITLGEEAVNAAYDPQAKETAAEQIEVTEQALFRLAQQGEAKGGFRAFNSVLTSTINMVEAAHQKAGKVTGVPTGLADLDAKLAGLQPSDLLILAARPSMGKTALAMTLAANAAAHKASASERANLKSDNYAVGVFSLEMSAEQIGMRLLSAESRIGSDDLRRGELRDEDWPKVVAASQRLCGRPLYIDDTPALTIGALRSRARRLMRTYGLSLLVVDYLQLLRGSGNYANSNRVQEISEITQGLKAIAKELNVPVLALSQLSRAVESREDKRPMLSDLRESGSIEQDADVVMFIFREQYYLERSEPQLRDAEKPEDFTRRFERWREACERSHNRADVIVAKQRNGPIGPIQVQFDPQFGRFYDLERGHYPVDEY
ncbi:MAG: replicative DNA helicase [Geminicoccaceae bacterium]|nr:replicative DNA helicase [Geminicoccaceae bacterium]